MSTVTAVPLEAVKRRVLVYLWIGILIAVLGAFALAWQVPVDPADMALAKVRRADASVVRTSSGLQYKVVKAGTGDAHPTDGDIVLVNYEGRLLDGTVFDKSQQPTPLQVTGVVPGFSEALKLMTKGGKYQVWIKPGLGYGNKASGPIPAHSVLVFDIELLDWKSEAEIRQMQMMQQMMQQQGGGAAPPPGAGTPPSGR